MPELRWILLGLGVLFCIGLWWRETRRPQQAAGSTARAREPARADQPSEPLDSPRRAPLEAPTGEPAIFEQEMIEPAVSQQEKAELPDPTLMGQERLARELFAVSHEETRERIEPILGDVEIATAETPRIEPAPAPQEKIVTLRLTAPPLERFDGRELVAALRAAGLEHGKFSIFHKLTADGATLFSVASLVEPGTFELDRIERRRFPGVSFFAVLPGPQDPIATLEEMVATARQLAETLHGTLQDEHGAPLSAQRLADLRAGVADWPSAPTAAPHH